MNNLSFIVRDPDEYNKLNTFFTYKNYLDHIIRIIEFTPINESYQPIGCKNKNYDEVINSLNSAFVYYHQIEKIMENGNINYFMPTVTIIAYYILYFGTRALLLTLGCEKEQSNDHSSILKNFCQQLEQKPGLLPSPFNIFFGGNGGFKNLPDSVNINRINPLKTVNSGTSIEDSFNSYGMFLRTTSEKKEKRNMQNNKSTKQKKGHKKVKNPPIVSYLDAMYRLRVRLNYQDLKPFMLASIEFPSMSVDFCDTLFKIVNYISIVFLQQIANGFKIEPEQLIKEISKNIKIPISIFK